jgi:molybdenum cofactor guanylyltransferase
MGQDKAFLVYAGEPLWKRQLGTLYKAGLAPLLMACRMEQKLAESVKSWAIDHGTDVMMVFDPEEESISERGPLAALVRCLKRAPGAILTLAVDMPLVSAEFLAKLRIAWGESEGGLVVQRKGLIEPLLSLWHPNSLEALEQALSQPQQPSLKRLLEAEQEAGRAVPWEVPDELELALANWNSPEDLRRGELRG